MLDASSCPCPFAADRARHRLWDSSAVAHATRWQLDLPDRAGTYRYLANVLAHQEDELARALDDRTRYFFDLAIRH